MVLVYLSGPYSKCADKEHVMNCIMRASGQYMLTHKGFHVVSPLFNHPSIALVPGMGSDYNFWGDYSRDLLQRCDQLLVLKYPGWDESTGVQDEIAFAREKKLPVEFFELSDLD
mmetsp:Transcript_29891/g.78818  ORF Transcript_29891/g.78818 Transcript_29891/m.78818 type:complete len:114 (-) Transcript_29891:26-367(-)|eukprot:CAMPEP_0113702918 /NCGR_PEP_ID=MMETSP0038_2-20120614/25512_1 /TAXON_ID=2898 /ORGANISM="Cryptomonas paramecium" /LENGTH=113 /DNA_ID=CAMNT_0000627205 /DNA_START=79 /DNA_END=420 /DNA_ORIENTATION=+ /assembly_acc=CAM_ASM_000170